MVVVIVLVVVHALWVGPWALSRRGRPAEGRHGVLFMTNCLLLIGKSLSKLFGFVYLYLGRVHVGFAASAVVHNGLF